MDRNAIACGNRCTCRRPGTPFVLRNAPMRSASCPYFPLGSMDWATAQVRLTTLQARLTALMPLVSPATAQSSLKTLVKAYGEALGHALHVATKTLQILNGAPRSRLSSS